MSEGRFSLSAWLLLAILTAISILGSIGVFALLNFISFLLIGWGIRCFLVALKGRQLSFTIRRTRAGLTEATRGLLLLYFRRREHYPWGGFRSLCQ